MTDSWSLLVIESGRRTGNRCRQLKRAAPASTIHWLYLGTVGGSGDTRDICKSHRGEVGTREGGRGAHGDANICIRGAEFSVDLTSTLLDLQVPSILSKSPRFARPVWWYMLSQGVLVLVAFPVPPWARGGWSCCACVHEQVGLPSLCSSLSWLDKMGRDQTLCSSDYCWNIDTLIWITQHLQQL